MANKISLSLSLSLNVGKTKYLLFHMIPDDLALKLPKLIINNQEIDRASCAKFVGNILVKIF